MQFYSVAFKNQSGSKFLNKRDIVVRHIFITILAFFFGTLGKFDLPADELQRHILGVFINIALIWNGNILLIDLLDQNLSWENHIFRKIGLSITIAIFWPILVNLFSNIMMYPIIFGKPCDMSSKESVTYMIISVVITLFINSLFAAIAFFRFWRQSIKEKEELKREGVTAEFEALKNQINPHFLFNSLNTLSSLIEENPKTANDFVQRLSTVYRYVLTQKNKDVVTLREELQFVQSYIYLNQIRFGNNLRVHMHIDSEYHSKKIVTLSLQMLVENAIKHNIISKDFPLTIYIGVHQGRLFVRNNLQQKTSTADSNGIGLNNIVHRYSMLTSEPVEVTDNTEDFIVSLPLL